MTPEQIRAAIVANPTLLAMAQAPNPDTQTIADMLAAAQPPQPVHTEIGNGTILAQLAPLGASGSMSGGVFLDTLVAIGQVDRDVYWTMDLIKQGRLRIDLEATRLGLQKLATAQPSLAPAVSELLKLGVVPAQVNEMDVRRAIFADDGQRMV